MSSPKKPPDPLAHQADHWLALLHSPLFDRKQQQALQRWLTNPANRVALQKAQAFWQKMGMLDAAQLALLEQRLAQTSAPKRKPKSKPLFVSMWLVSALACCLLLLMPAWQIWQSLAADYRTATGEQRVVELADGSRVLLNTASVLSVDFSQQRRHVVLHEGEAHFKVAKDTNRPFEVETAIGTIRALGTAFAVKQMDDDLTVTVDEHAVRVTFSNGSIIESLREGEQVSLHQQQISIVKHINLNQAMAWQQRRLVFKDQPLQQVVAELSRYRNGAIFITDNRLAQHQVTGVFDANDTETALLTIEKSLGLKEYRMTDRLVVLFRQ